MSNNQINPLKDINVPQSEKTQEIKAAWEAVLRVKYRLVEKGIDNNGWYSNERNGQWLPLQGDDMKLYDFRNNNTEVRPKSLGDNNPQEVPQVKRVGTSFDETIALQKIKNLYAESRGFNSWPHFLNEYDPNERIYDLISVEYSNYQSSSLQSRIAELEKQNSELEALQKSDEKHIKSLEKQIKQYEGIVDKHIISSANYTAEYVDNVIAERDKYMEALEIAIKEIKYQYRQKGKLGGDILNRIEKALNSKDNQ